jgi:hypothetical protein
MPEKKFREAEPRPEGARWGDIGARNRALVSDAGIHRHARGFPRVWCGLTSTIDKETVYSAGNHRVPAQRVPYLAGNFAKANASILATGPSP